MPRLLERQAGRSQEVRQLVSQRRQLRGDTAVTPVGGAEPLALQGEMNWSLSPPHRLAALGPAPKGREAA